MTEEKSANQIEREANAERRVEKQRTVPPVPGIKVYDLPTWQDLYLMLDAKPEILGDPHTAIVVRGGTNKRDITSNGLVALIDCENSARLQAKYLLSVHAKNNGDLYHENGYWHDEHVLGNVSMVPNGTRHVPIELTVKSFGEAYKYYTRLMLSGGRGGAFRVV